jgi:hypothetical protein
MFASLLLTSALAGTYVDPIEAAHGTETYTTREAVHATFDVQFGAWSLKAEGWFDTPLGKARLETADGTVVVFDGTTAWVSPSDAGLPGPPPRFHVLTWPYFLAAPHKLSDPGTHLADVGSKPLTAEASLPAAKLTFGEGVGDAPDDWYYVFRAPETDRLRALAYIVTYGRDRAEAEKKKSIVFYDGYEQVDGVTFATDYTFYYWDEDTGRSAEPKGTMTVSDIGFVDLDAAWFVKPEGAREDTLPKP